jgi:hypothetical protein
MLDVVLPFFGAVWLVGGGFGLFYLIDRLKGHVNFIVAFLISLGWMAIVFLILVCVIKLVDAICPKCYRYSPTFVWSWGEGGHKHLCEKCSPSRIKEVFGNNLNYVEHLAKQRKLV